MRKNNLLDYNLLKDVMATMHYREQEEVAQEAATIIMRFLKQDHTDLVHHPL